jgi:RNA polymerase sigma-70 factor (ECF subfamily)
MDCSVQPDPERLLTKARAGDQDSLGRLLESYRGYLRALACSKIDLRLQARANPSDLIQETFLLASRHFNQFRGQSEREWLHWLRRILRRCVSRFVRKHGWVRKRNAYREISLEREPLSPVPGHGAGRPQIADSGSSPSARAQRRELASLVAERLARLSPAHRDVLILRNLKGLAFEEVARRMRRSPGAVRVLWLRALDQLRCQGFPEDWL